MISEIEYYNNLFLPPEKFTESYREINKKKMQNLREKQILEEQKNLELLLEEREKNDCLGPKFVFKV